MSVKHSELRLDTQPRTPIGNATSLKDWKTLHHPTPKVVPAILVKIPRSAFYYLKGLNVTVIFIDVIISKAEVVMIVKIRSLSFKYHKRIDSITLSFYLHVNKNAFAVSFFFPIRSPLVIHSLTEILLSY